MSDSSGFVANCERWLPVVDWDGWYQVSDRGQVRSVPRIVEYLGRWGMTRRFFPARLLRPQRIWDGHLRVVLVGDGQRQYCKVHVLVLTAFVGRRPTGLLGCHNDGDPANNHVSNLRWDTPSSNSCDTLVHGTNHNAAKVSCPRDHALVPPNLMPSRMKVGHRSCLACSRALNFVRRTGGGFDVCDPRFKAIADQYHEQIMRGVQAA